MSGPVTTEERLAALEDRVRMLAAQVEILERLPHRLRALEHYNGLESRSAPPDADEITGGSSDPSGEGRR